MKEPCSTLKKISIYFCRFQKCALSLQCLLLFNRGGSVAHIHAGGIFYAAAYRISSVPCGALMRPLPRFQGGRQRGAELFLYPNLTNQFYNF